MLGLLFESVPIGGKHLVSVKPRDDIASLFAIKLVVQTGGPDRGLNRGSELAGVRIEGVDDLRELAVPV